MKPRLLIGLAAWAVLAMAALSLASDPNMAVPVFLFWAGSGFLAVRGVIRLIQRKRSAPRNQAVTVCVCLAKPRHSPDIERIKTQLPPYCRLVMGRGQVSGKEA